MGLGSFEGIHPDDAGNIYLIEDASGTRPGGAARAPETGRLVPLRAAAQPNSFVYRYLPNNPARLEDGGKMQALQVSIDGQPVKFGGVGPAAAAADIISLTQKKLHTPGTSWPIKWVTIHRVAKGDTQALTATQAAKDAGATPFKRPENMTWLPESQLRTFFFSATGDTDAPTSQESELAARGAWGSLFRVDLNHEPTSKRGAKGKPRDDGIISIFVLGDQVHNSFDNVAFANEHQLLAAEDRGDTLHQQLNALNSVWAFDVDRRQPLASALRFIALGRDALAAPEGEEDNEPTGLVVSNGSTRKEDLLGTRKSLDGARLLHHAAWAKRSVRNPAQGHDRRQEVGRRGASLGFAQSHGGIWIGAPVRPNGGCAANVRQGQRPRLSMPGRLCVRFLISRLLRRGP